ncbi:MAG TPA: hypothetical protein VHG72_10410 [Polyangia bacterium]|nr:hypothetical protein [Polyangia bacterium]
MNNHLGISVRVAAVLPFALLAACGSSSAGGGTGGASASGGTAGGSTGGMSVGTGGGSSGGAGEAGSGASGSGGAGATTGTGGGGGSSAPTQATADAVADALAAQNPGKSAVVILDGTSGAVLYEATPSLSALNVEIMGNAPSGDAGVTGLAQISAGTGSTFGFAAESPVLFLQPGQNAITNVATTGAIAKTVIAGSGADCQGETGTVTVEQVPTDLSGKNGKLSWVESCDANKSTKPVPASMVGSIRF